MDNVEILLFIGLTVVVIALIFWMFSRTAEEREYDRKLKESLKDEYIIDPETGAKLTLEQAESGHWIAHDNEFKTIPKAELNKLPTEGAKQAEIALNYLRESKDYRKTRFSEEQHSVLEELKTFKNYDDWSYSDSYKFEGGAVFLPSVELNLAGHYRESHLMFWVKIDSINGHYFFREKTSSEKIFDLIRNDDEIKSDRYECFTIKKSHSIIQINRILEAFEKEKGLEVEIENDNLFVKTLKLVSLEDINRVEKMLIPIIKV
ncbi:hypothetical protein [Flavivirga spongiicola]|uniref:DUF4340 domain-containing protein n=1 Tax=Flavivirga spongiicola TaxID=421621 RepID=A0ABU7XTX1_9FLAO|nr:hypothetical protein [Flavivirga sp. MEBiC05379]MDO5979196.1 hypothetical protein [Flavivirga sp. MEBiC05379]